VRSGDIRRAILSALRDAPAHGYEVMRRLGEMSGGLWRPSPGSIYPHLQLLEDEEMVHSTEHDGTRNFPLTGKGAAEAANNSSLPWRSHPTGRRRDPRLTPGGHAADERGQATLRGRRKHPGLSGGSR
jgi:DNA-binding PadR family transcriptional regulator